MATYRKLLKNRAGDTILPVVDVLNYLYPVGSIYMSATMSTASQVMAAFGGIWVAWGAGKVPVGVDTSQTEFNAVEKTGGEKTHTLVTNEMPKHSHSVTNQNTTTFLVPSGNYYGLISNQASASTGQAGGDQPHNNLQPYITCYMYKRTA